MLVSLEDYKQVLDYCRETGTFRWKQPRCRNKIKAGTVAGYIRRDGYRDILFRKTHIMAHRLVWLFEYGGLPEHPLTIDHINRNKDDNRITNLRVVCKQKQQFNRSTRSKYPNGIRVRYNRYVVEIKVGKTKLHLGYFKTLDEAVSCRRDVELQWVGESRL